LGQNQNQRPFGSPISFPDRFGWIFPKIWMERKIFPAISGRAGFHPKNPSHWKFLLSQIDYWAKMSSQVGSIVPKNLSARLSDSAVFALPKVADPLCNWKEKVWKKPPSTKLISFFLKYQFGFQEWLPATCNGNRPIRPAASISVNLVSKPQHNPEANTSEWSFPFMTTIRRIPILICMKVHCEPPFPFSDVGKKSRRTSPSPRPRPKQLNRGKEPTDLIRLRNMRFLK